MVDAPHTHTQPHAIMHYSQEIDAKLSTVVFQQLQGVRVHDSSAECVSTLLLFQGFPRKCCIILSCVATAGT